VIAWEDNSGLGGDDSESSVKAQVFGADGSRSAASSWSIRRRRGAEAASITALANGGFVVTWDDNSGLGGDDSDHRSRRRSSTPPATRSVANSWSTP
jgi:hypothetical protein